MWWCCVVLGALAFWPAAAADIQCAIERGASGDVLISWADGTPTDGYALECGSNLVGGTWDYTSDIDTWPTDKTNWTTQTSMRQGFYRMTETSRGRLIGAVTQVSYSTFEIGVALSLAGLTEFSPNYPVTVYGITYETFDHRGQSTLASGALAVPVGAPAVPMISYQHGTIFERSNAPSVNTDEHLLGVAFATEGYVAAMPDYIGLGTNSPALHPYVHARSEAVAAVDMLRASKFFVTNSLLASLNGELFIAGYSQGGHVTLALQRELETHHASEFPLTASAPMAGPHDLSGTMRDWMLSDATNDSPSYVGYILFGYDAVYDIFDDASDVLRAPYATTLPPLFDGEHSSSEIDAAMTNVPKHIFTTEFLSDFETNMTSVFNRGLMTNDTYRWVPSVTTRLYHCAADETVPAVNTIVAHSNFVANGSVHVTTRDPSPTSTHTEGAAPCLNAANAWFESL